ncbi:MAG: hypothetical protein AUF63_02400 [Candidatus Rokubacteria bacterium 13_1_20CM_70_15]|nr:MAG: hypothetical protein AUF63_02400 [Candidatus Rokubacteria bacterium 13_1_20CM_70_15]
MAAKSPPPPSTIAPRPRAISWSVSSSTAIRAGWASKGLVATGPSWIAFVLVAATARRRK